MTTVNASIRHKCGHLYTRELTTYNPFTKMSEVIQDITHLDPPQVLLTQFKERVTKSTRRAQKYWGDQECVPCWLTKISGNIVT